MVNKRPTKQPVKYNKVKLNPSLPISKAMLNQMTHTSNQIRRRQPNVGATNSAGSMPLHQTQGVHVSAAYGAISKKSAPVIRVLSDGRAKAVNSELFATVVGPGSSAFTMRSFNLNPALTNTGRWLPSQTRFYTKYVYAYLCITYEPITGTDTEGAVYMAWEPNVLEDLPTDKFQMSALINSTSGPCWARNQLVIPVSKELYIRRGGVIGSTLTSFDHGKFYVGTSDTGGVTTGLGDLRISYIVTLSGPHTDVSSAMSYGNQVVRGAASISNATLLGTSQTTSGNTRIVDLTSLVQATNTVTLRLADVPSSNSNGAEQWNIFIRIFSVGATGATPSATIGGIALTIVSQTSATVTNITLLRHTTSVDPSNLNLVITNTTTSVNNFQVELWTGANSSDWIL